MLCSSVGTQFRYSLIPPVYLVSLMESAGGRGSIGVGSLACQVTDEDEIRSISGVILKYRWASGFPWLRWRWVRPQKAVMHLRSPKLFQPARQRRVAAAKVSAGKGLWWHWVPDCLGMIQEDVNWSKPAPCLESFWKYNKPTLLSL